MINILNINITFIDITFVILSYLLGSIPFGLIVGKIAKIGDIRTKGSGNIGATNVVRIGGKKLGALVFLLDAFKGAIPVIIAKEFLTWEIALISAGFAVIGHIFPVWLKFKGGKGVATTLAVYTALLWQMGVALMIVWIITFITTKYSSLSSIFAMIIAPLVAFYFDKDGLEFLALIISIIVIARHYSNIKRLFSGEEGGFKK